MPGRRRCQSEIVVPYAPGGINESIVPACCGTRSAGPAVHPSWLRAAIPSGIQHAIICQEPVQCLLCTRLNHKQRLTALFGPFRHARRRCAQPRRPQADESRPIRFLGTTASGIRPGDADHRGAANIFPDRRAADSDRSSDHPLARPQAYFRRRTSRTFRIGNLSAGQSDLPVRIAKGGTLPGADCRQRSHHFTPHQHGWAAFDRIGWPLSVGIGGRIGSDIRTPGRPQTPAANSDNAWA